MRKEIKKQLQMIMDQAVKDNQIAGMNMMVIKDGQEEAYLQCGYADKANGRMIELLFMSWGSRSLSHWFLTGCGWKLEL